MERHPNLFSEKQLKRFRIRKENIASLLSRSTDTKRSYFGYSNNEESIIGNVACSSYGSIQAAENEFDIIPYDIEEEYNDHDTYLNVSEKEESCSSSAFLRNKELRRINSKASCNNLPENLFPINEDSVCIEG